MERNTLRRSLPRLTVRALAVSLIALGLLVGTPDSPRWVAQAATAEDPAPNGEEPGYERHELGIFVGGATRSEEHHSETGFALGAGYEYRFTRFVGVGAIVEAATLDFRDVVLFAPLFVHPVGGLWLTAAPGAEVANDGTEFAFRLGLGYKIPVGRFSISPEFNADLIRGEPTYVYGLTFSYGF